MEKPSEYVKSIIEWFKAKYETETVADVRDDIVDAIHYLTIAAADYQRDETTDGES